MYSLRPPSAPLAGLIERYWFVDARARPVELQVDVFVDGQADLVFNFGDPWWREVPGRPPEAHARSVIDAQRRHPMRVRQAGSVHIVGVRFALGGLGAFTPRSVGELTDQTPPPSALWGAAAEALEGALAQAQGEDAQASLLDAFFINHLQPADERAVLQRALRAVQGAPPPARISTVARSLGLSVRSLERLFQRHIGLTARMVTRIARFQGAIRALMIDPGCTLAALADRAGYFDQAHFVREFREMAGGLPRDHRGYFPEDGPREFAPNLVAYIQDGPKPAG